MATRMRSFIYQGSGAILAAVVATASVSVPDHRATAGSQSANVAADSTSGKTTSERQGHFLIVTNTPARPDNSSVIHHWPD